MKIRLSLAAASDLDRIIEYLEERNPLAAAETVESIFNAIDLLLQFPEMGRLGEEPDTRELVIENTFVVPYRVREDIIEVVRVWHGARDRRK